MSIDAPVYSGKAAARARLSRKPGADRANGAAENVDDRISMPSVTAKPFNELTPIIQRNAAKAARV